MALTTKYNGFVQGGGAIKYLTVITSTGISICTAGEEKKAQTNVTQEYVFQSYKEPNLNCLFNCLQSLLSTVTNTVKINCVF